MHARSPHLAPPLPDASPPCSRPCVTAALPGAVLEAFVESHEWAHFLCAEPANRSNTSVCLTLDLPEAAVTKLTKMLEKEGVAYDINAYRTAPPGLRIWCGSTIEAADLSAMCEWLAWGYETVKAEL